MNIEPIATAAVIVAFLVKRVAAAAELETVYIIEARVEGQTFDEPFVPFRFVVQDTAVRVFKGPRWIFKRMIRFEKSPADPGEYVYWVDYFDPHRGVAILSESPPESQRPRMPATITIDRRWRRVV